MARTFRNSFAMTTEDFQAVRERHASFRDKRKLKRSQTVPFVQKPQTKEERDERGSIWR